MIKVSRQKFYEIFKDDKYKSQVQKGIWERSSCPYYDVIDTTTNEVVGVYSDGSWENTFEVIIELASKEDIISHYEDLLKYKESELERTRQAWKKLKEYKDLSIEDRALQDKKEREEREWRKTHPGMMQFIEEENLIKYNPLDSDIADIINKNFSKLY